MPFFLLGLARMKKIYVFKKRHQKLYEVLIMLVDMICLYYFISVLCTTPTQKALILMSVGADMTLGLLSLGMKWILKSKPINLPQKLLKCHFFGKIVSLCKNQVKILLMSYKIIIIICNFFFFIGMLIGILNILMQ